MKLTINWLIANATETSFERGEEYQDAVSKLQKQGNKYTATVHGTEKYKVEVVESADDIYAHCTCPYGYEGICKHIVAVGLNIVEENYVEINSIETIEQQANPLQNEDENEPVETDTFYEKEFLKARSDKREAFIRMLFVQDANLCRRFLSYIRPPAPPLSNSTDLDELSNEIAARLMDIDIDDYIPEEDEDEDSYYGRRDYDYEEGDRYDTDALEEEVLRLIQPYGNRTMQALEDGRLLDSARILLSVYEAIFLIEEGVFGEYTDFSYQSTLDTFFNQITTDWIYRLEDKTYSPSDYQAILQLILDRWQQFAHYHDEDETAPYELLGEDLFLFIIQQSKAEQQFLDFMTEHNLHTSSHYELTKMLCNALGKSDFLLEKLASYGLDNHKLAQELMQQYIDRGDRNRFVSVAQKASEQYRWQLNEFIADQILPKDNLGFFKKIVSEVAAYKGRLDLYYRWRQQATAKEQEDYIQSNKKSHPHFYITLLADSQRFPELLTFAKECVETPDFNNSMFYDSSSFEAAAKLILHLYPDAIFTLYCQRVIKYMGNSASSRSHYQQAISMLKPLKNIKGKEQSIKAFATELRQKYNRLPAFLDELKKGGF